MQEKSFLYEINQIYYFRHEHYKLEIIYKR